MMGGLHPRASLYERPVNIESAKATHAAFRQVLREHGVRVLTVREILAYGVDEHIGARVDLEARGAAAAAAARGGALGAVAARRCRCFFQSKAPPLTPSRPP